MKITLITTASIALLACLLSTASYADGFSDLKSALTKEQGKSPIKADFEIKTWSKQGEEKDLEEQSGFATIAIEDNTHGLQLLFGRELLEKLNTEQRAKEQDHKAKTPTSNAANGINTKAVQEMTSAASSLLSLLSKVEFKSERVDTYNGKPARCLSFTFSKEKLTAKEREHLKKYEGTADIWIAEDGTPLAYHSHEVLTASFLMLVSFDATNEDSTTFTLVGDRLVATHKETKEKGSGLGQQGENTTIRHLLIQS